MHKAIVAKIDRVIEIEGANTIQEAVVLGEHVVVSKTWKEGDIGIFFPVDLQLSEEYCKANNLFRDSTKNIDETKKGFFESNRRIRAQPFMKIRSCGLFMPFDSLSLLETTEALNNLYVLGYTFDTLSTGIKICEKYISEQAKVSIGNRNVKAVKQSVFPFFQKHVDTEQFRHFAERIPTGALLSFHSKQHGTSGRWSKQKRVVELSKWKKAINKIIPLFKTEGDYELVVGTRNVVLESPERVGFHGKEEYRYEIGRMLYPYMEDGMTIYGEILGFVDGKPIMPDGDVSMLKDKKYTKKYGEKVAYSYGCKQHEYKFFIYRITRLTHSGMNIDMSQKELEKWCQDRGFEHTYEVFPQLVYGGNVEALRELVESLTERPECLTEDFQYPNQISEGIIIRVDNGKPNPDFYKSKSYAFRVMETGLEVNDIETLS